MVEFIRAENIKALVSHLVEKFGAELAEVDYVDTFQALRLKYDQVRRFWGFDSETADFRGFFSGCFQGCAAHSMAPLLCRCMAVTAAAQVVV